MSDTTKTADLPDRFIVLEGSQHTPPIPKVYLFVRMTPGDWDKFRFYNHEWTYVDNVGDATAIEAFQSGTVYARLKRD